MNIPKAYYVKQINDLSVHASQLIQNIAAHCTDPAAMGAARSNLVELRTMLSVAMGEHIAVMPELLPLQRAVNTVLQAIHDSNVEPRDIDGLTDEEAIAALAHQEDVVFWLDQARNAGLAMISHLNTAIINRDISRQKVKP